jgi:hypothetical protein
MKTNRMLAEEILAYAKAHYNEGGWDYMVECETVEEIEEELDDLRYTTFEQVLAFYKEIYDILEDRRQEEIAYRRNNYEACAE